MEAGQHAAPSTALEKAPAEEHAAGGPEPELGLPAQVQRNNEHQELWSLHACSLQRASAPLLFMIMEELRRGFGDYERWEFGSPQDFLQFADIMAWLEVDHRETYTWAVKELDYAYRGLTPHFWGDAHEAAELAAGCCHKQLPPIADSAAWVLSQIRRTAPEDLPLGIGMLASLARFTDQHGEDIERYLACRQKAADKSRKAVLRKFFKTETGEKKGVVGQEDRSSQESSGTQSD